MASVMTVSLSCDITPPFVADSCSSSASFFGSAVAFGDASVDILNIDVTNRFYDKHQKCFVSSFLDMCHFIVNISLQRIMQNMFADIPSQEPMQVLRGLGKCPMHPIGSVTER